jgi:hypothetical protein
MKNSIVLVLLVVLAIIMLLTIGLTYKVSARNHKSDIDAPAPKMIQEKMTELQRQSRNKRWSAFKAAFASPINLHGKVVDQHDRPIEDAKVEYSVLGLDGSQEGQKISDEGGAFNITGYKGASIFVRVNKIGYRRLPSLNEEVGSDHRFTYDSNQSPISSPVNPIVFTLQRPGVIESLVHLKERNYRVPRDGSPVEINLHPGVKDLYRVVLRCWNEDNEHRPSGDPRYYWRLEIEAPGGGIRKRTSAMAFEAPETGYETKAIIEMPADNPTWSRSANLTYFIKFADNVYARVNAEMIAGGDHFIVWESYLNPKAGSLHLDANPE